MANPQYLTSSGDTWDMISFKLYNNEYFMDQLITANPKYINTEVFDAGTLLIIPTVLIPRSISTVVWGSIVRFA